MEIKKITKTDKNGSRLFVEISGKMKHDFGLPDLKKGDEVLIMPARKLSKADTERIVGKYIKYFDISYEDNYALSFEGVLKKNEKGYWDPDNDLAGFKYALIDPVLGPMDSFNDLSHAFDLKVIPGKERYVNKVECYRCRKEFFEAYKHCPHCGKANRQYRKSDKN